MKFTSLKLRNPKNKPDNWEEQFLRKSEESWQAGARSRIAESSEIVASEKGKEFRYIKAIPTAKICLDCHGTEVKSNVEAALKQTYPQDQATGYKMGDLRGAIILSKKI
ncbi:DUF3365 domain-containing protein [Gammaproteobacteria bacterium]